MLCDKCKKNNAVVFYNENINGVKKSFALCSECAKKAEESGEITTQYVFENPFDEAINSFNTILGGLFGKPTGLRSAVKEKKKCSLCGMTFDDILDSGKVGCSNCYMTFADDLEDIIKRIHGTSRHVQNRIAENTENNTEPENEKAEEISENSRRISELKSRLDEAVRDERYEEAAKLRDEINELKRSEDK